MRPSTSSGRAARIAAVVAATGFLLVAGFQLGLALGRPWGLASWGGAPAVLPPGLRIASGGAVAVLAIAALIVLGRAGYRVPTFPRIVLRWGTWGLVALLALSALGNSLSASPRERYLMAPAALALALLCLVVARGGSGREV
jgi:hypothetical protein